ncbi:amino acid adenylation domain-containing protein [Gordonia sp. ABSL11-1]|uniref:non-ribosomal peptide synthetase n=1 Tax=Gordonia sp. ABSL11-1 TaxID=3053924 RepID=UPI0025743BDB|nr:non-ribosomal peptide synthetase [Gordonia sp. ABSL11-1]MDL9948687.1 amino acid adenylation domain-containing protein [Gordonia sp. ABSL11-1]
MTEQTVTAIGVTGAQAGVWYGQQLIGPSSTFVVGQTWEPHEPVHLRSLVDAISATIGEAPGLSCAFGTEDGEVVARPHAHRVDDVAVVDLSGDDDPAAAATRWMRERARTQLDPATDPCFEATVLRLDRESVQSPGHASVIVCVRAHHIVADVFALGLLGRRAGELYAAARTGFPARDAWFDPLTAVLDAECQYRASGDRGRDEEFWRDELTTVGDVTGLRPAVGGDRRASGVLSDQVMIDGATADLLAELGARHGGSWGDAVTGILAAHIAGRAGSAGAVLGYPMMNRLGTPAFAVPTMVVNVVPLALSVDGWSTVDEVTSAAMTGIRRIRPHAWFRGEEIARLGDGGLPPIWLNVKAIDDHLSFGGVDVTVHSLARGPVEELTITVRRSVTGDIELQLDADDSRYDRRRLAELAEDLADILCRAAQPDAWVRPVGRTALGASSDRHVQTDPGSSTSTFADLLAEGIGERASSDQDGIAVVAGGVEVSRADLDRRVRQLAGRLVADGVMPDDRVAVLLPRDESAVVALAAVAVAGGVVVPIDPDYPADRLRHILTDSRPTVILTRRDVALPETSATIVHLDDGATWTAAGSRGSEPPHMGACRTPTRPDHLSCIAYTSGSTGVPKGVMVTQAGLVNRLAWAARDWLHDDVTRGPSDRITLWKSPAGFIDGITEVFGALVRGDRIVVAGGDAARDPRALVRLLDRHRVSHLTAVPSLLRELVGDSVAPISTVALWVSSGEPLPAAVVRQVRRFDPTARLINSYGSTEVTGDATYGDVHADDDVTIGSAVPGCRVTILDSWLRPVPVGDVGELYVGGIQLARGYHGRPEWTADRFVADPAADGARMYRTGDRAVRDGDGRIRVIGRADDQVKIRGVRVEPAEVERAVAQAPGVDEAVVVVARDAHDDPSLIAYVTADSPIDIAMVRAHVAGTLPSQMVPADIVEVAAIPRSAHGKIDRRALPTIHSRPDDDATPPATPTEEAVAEAFSTVLRRGGRSRTDDFFALGGHSLLVTRLLNRLGEQFGVNLEMRDVFDRPTVAEIADMVDRRRDDGTHAASVLPRIDDVGPRPTVTGLSAAQERLWFLFRLEGRTAAYNIPIVLRIPEEPDLAALDAALYDVIERHETLRTVIAEDDGGVAWQHVLPMDEVRWTATVMDVDAEGTDDAVRSVAAHRFDLATEIPFRAVVIRGRAGAGRGTEATGSACSIVLLVHHIAGDEWSSPILVDDLSRAYLARIAGARVSPFTAAPLPVSYRDHTHWQHVVRDHPRRRDGIERWRRRLHGAPEELALPYDRPRPSITSYRGDRVAFRLDPVIADRLRRTARDRRVSMFMLIHAAVALMLSEDGAGDDIVVGTPVAGRDDAAAHGLVGFFVNMVVLRTDLGGDPTVGELIDRIRADDLDAMSLSDVPFEAVVDAVSPERAMGRHPLFGVMVQFRADWAIPDFAGLPTEVTPIDPGTAKFDLTVDVTEHSGSGAIDVRFDYATDLFDRTTGEMLARHLDRALELLGSAPDLRLSQAGLLDDDERAAVLHEWALPSSVPAHWGGTERSPRRVTVDDRLRTAATRYARLHAIRFGDTVIDHAGLDRAASSVASTLRQAGVVGGDRVAVLVSRSELLPIAIAGVLRSGATCVPVDATHPDDRIEYILRDSGAVVVLTDGPTRIPVPEERARERHEGPRTIHLDRDILKPSGPETPDPENPPPPIDPASSAMLLYTSGSTGEPKGVVLPHAALAHRIGLAESDFGIGPNSVGISKSAIGFVDASTELFGVLCAGGSVVVADDTTARDPSALAAMIRAQQVTELVTVPTMARVIADAGTLPSLRRWVCSGEALTADTARRMAACAPDATIVNLYGSTEITGDVTVHEVDGPRDVDAGVPIGRPLPGSSVYVLDHRLRPAAPGVRGELYVGGAHLADGYHGRSRETATRFVAHPFAATPGERLYRTGDLARWDRTGALHVLGRSDDQVTIRGVRIEPGEVVGTLESLPDVDGALVISTSSALTGASMLVAYVVLRQTNPGSNRVDGQALRAQLIDRLPESMIPAAVMIVDRFPMTPNGKIDRRALPAPEVDTATRHREPSTDREGILREIVARELGLGPDRIGDVGIDDDFFALGGDSIASLRVVAAAVRAGIAVTSRQMLELRTVAALAAAAGEVVDSGEGSAVVDDGSPSTTANDSPIPVPPNAVVQRLRALGRAVDDCVVTAAVNIDTPPDGGAVAQAVDAAIRRHDALRLRVTPKNKLVWVTEVMPVDSVVVEHPSGPPPESVAEAAGRAVGRVRITEGAPLAVETVAGERPALVAAAHQVAADRDSLHVVLTEIVDVLEGRIPTAPAASIVDITTALDDLTRGDEAGRRVERIVAGAPAILAARPARPRATDDTRTATASAVLATTDADAIRDAFVVALLAETGDGSLDVAVDLGTLLSSPLLSDTCGPDPVLPDPGAPAVASWSAVHPWSVTDGTPLDLGTDDDPSHAGAWFAVLRHGHRGVRKAVKRVADGPALLTGSRGVSARPSLREGDEADHGIVGRFRVADDTGIDVPATTEITVLAPDADLAERLAAAWVSAIAERG